MKHRPKLRRSHWLLAVGFAVLLVILPVVRAEQRASLPRTLHVEKKLCDLMFSADSRTLLTTHALSFNAWGPQSVSIWDVASGKQVRTLPVTKRYPATIGVSYDGRTVAAADRDNKVTLWSTETGNLQHTLYYPVKDQHIQGLSFSPDGQFLIELRTSGSRTAGDPVILWNLRTGQVQRVFQAGVIVGCGFSPNGKILALSTLSDVQFWNILTERRIATLKHQFFLFPLIDFAPNNKEVFVGDGPITGAKSYTVRVLNLQTGAHRIMASSPQLFYNLMMSPDGTLLAMASNDGNAPADHTRVSHGKVKVWDTRTGKVRLTLTDKAKFLELATFSPDGTLIAATSELGSDRNVLVWDVKTGELLRTLPVHHEFMRQPAFSPDSKTLAVGSDDGTLTLWPLR